MSNFKSYWHPDFDAEKDDRRDFDRGYDDWQDGMGDEEYIPDDPCEEMEARQTFGYKPKGER